MTPGEQLARSFESYATLLPNGSCKAYWDSLGGVWTIGFGSTGHDVKSSTIWSRDTAESRFSRDYACARKGVLRASPHVSGNHLEALTSWAYNCGVGAYQTSTLRRYVNASRWLAAANEFPKWNHSGGRVVAGLTRRRAAERALFLKPDVTPSDTEPDSQVPVSPPIPWIQRFLNWLLSVPLQ